MATRALPDDPRLRGLIYGAGAVIATLVLTQFVMPGRGGARGTPAAILFLGLITGAFIALTAVGMIVVYRALRIINFAQAVMGVMGSTLAFWLVVLTPVPFPLAFVAGVGLSAVVGLLFGLFTLRFFRSSRLFLTVVTLVSIPFMLLLLQWVPSLPFFPPEEERGDLVITPEEFDRMLPLPGFDFTIGGFDLRFGFGELFVLDVAVIALIAVFAFFRYTKTGVAIRALAENPERASLLGVSVGAVSLIVWTIAGMLSGAAVTSAVALEGGVSGSSDPAFLLPILAAAVFAGLERFGVAILASVLIGVVQQAWLYSWADHFSLYRVLLFAVIVGGLLVQRRRSTRSEQAEVSWSATDEARPIPKELAGITGIRVARWALIAVVAATAILFPFLASTGRVFLFSVIFLNAIAVLSLVVLTGWAGQVSLGQYALMAVGSVVGGALTARVGLPFWLAIPVAIAVGAAVAVVVGLPALRIRGLFLMATTFAFAVAVEFVLFDERYFDWLLPGEVERPTLFFIDFENETSMYFLSLLALVLSVVVVRNLRASRVGRVLIALRENEANVQAFGVSVIRAKLLAFAIAGGMAAFAGVVFAHQQRGISAETFTSQQSVIVFVQAVIGGVSSPLGALLGSAYWVLATDLVGDNEILQTFFQGFGPLFILFMAPGGFVSLINTARDSVLRIVAQRRRIVVPSLFADYDPDVLENRLIPLAEADPNSGLGALPVNERFALSSELYQGTGERVIDKLGPAKEDREAATIGAAGRAAAEIEAGAET